MFGVSARTTRWQIRSAIAAAWRSGRVGAFRRGSRRNFGAALHEGGHRAGQVAAAGSGPLSGLSLLIPGIWQLPRLRQRCSLRDCPIFCQFSLPTRAMAGKDVQMSGKLSRTLSERVCRAPRLSPPKPALAGAGIIAIVGRRPLEKRATLRAALNIDADSPAKIGGCVWRVSASGRACVSASIARSRWCLRTPQGRARAK